MNNVLSCEVEEAHSGLAFLLNTTFKEGMTELELFEITRGVWHNVPRDESLKFAYAMHNDIVQEVYEIKDWVKAGTQEYQTRNFEGRDISKRWEFIGQKANAEIRNKYVGKSIVKNRSYGCPFVKVGFKNQEGNSAMKSENFSANKISYMVLAHVQTEDGWGASIQGVGTEPIYILEDSSNDRVIAFVGNDFDTAKVFEGEIVSEVLDAYLDSCNVIAEFNELADENIEKSYFMKFMSSALEGDIAEIADDREVSILNDDETENEDILSESENCYGVWVLTIDDAEISCDLNRNSLTINGAELDDLASIFDELHGNSNSVAVFLSKSK